MSKAEPFGYKKNFLGNKEEISDQLEALKQAEYYIYQGCTMQSVRNWLVTKTGRDISVPGLLKAIKYDSSKKGNQDQNTPSNS